MSHAEDCMLISEKVRKPKKGYKNIFTRKCIVKNNLVGNL